MKRFLAFSALAAMFASASAQLSPIINEFSVSTVGNDVEFYELFANPGQDLSNFWVLQIEGDSASNKNIVTATQAGTTDASGYYLASLSTNTVQNGTLTLLLVAGFSGTTGTNLDADNDGVFDSTPWANILDSVAINDGGAGDLTYSNVVLGVSYDGLPFAPGGASRIPNGLDTDSVSDWMRNDFDLAGIPGFTGTPIVGEALNTPGAVNQPVPEPATLAALGLGAMALIRRKRNK